MCDHPRDGGENGRLPATAMVARMFVCSRRRQVPNCGFTSGFQGEPSGGIVPGIEFARAYGDGTFATGFFGLEDVTIGGLVAHNQRVGFVNYTLWNGDGRSAGLMGLGYPYLTSLDIGGEEVKAQLYDPVFTTLWRSKAIPPVFSVALSRFGDQSAGRPKDAVNTKGMESFLALGGLPPVAIDEGSWGRTPLLPMDVLKRWGFRGQGERGFYAIAADAYVFGNRKGGVGTASEEGLSRNTSQFPVVVDIGSTDTVLPNGMFSPGALVVRSIADGCSPHQAAVRSLRPPRRISLPSGSILGQVRREGSRVWHHAGWEDVLICARGLASPERARSDGGVVPDRGIRRLRLGNADPWCFVLVQCSGCV